MSTGLTRIGKVGRSTPAATPTAFPLASDQAASDRIGVIDIGSNSLRLVVYHRLGRAPVVLFNEKAMCGLGRGLGSTGRLNPEGVKSALENLERFTSFARSIGVGRLEAIATSAVRDAKDGAAFVKRVEERCGLDIRVIDGAEEGRLSALGVLSAIPDADGLVADLGGGSCEVVLVGDAAGAPSDPERLAGHLEQAIGARTTLPVGPLRFLDGGENSAKAREIVEREIASVPWITAARGKQLYFVGGTWRALAHTHMEQTGYPLHIIQGYSVPRAEAERLVGLIGNLGRKSLERLGTVSRKRLETVPIATSVMLGLIRAVAPATIVFSGQGLREGLLYDRLTGPERAMDPLVAAAEIEAARYRRFGADGRSLAHWLQPAFANATPAERRLDLVASILSDTGWSEHPDYRASQIFTRALQIQAGGIDHAGRVFLATSLHARYGGTAEDPQLVPTARILRPGQAERARALGQALRLAYTLTGGAPALLARTALSVIQRTLVLHIGAIGALASGEAVARRLEALGRSLDLQTRIEGLAEAAE